MPLSPHVAFVIFDAVLLQKRSILILEGDPPVMLLLPLDVIDNLISVFNIENEPSTELPENACKCQRQVYNACRPETRNFEIGIPRRVLHEKS